MVRRSERPPRIDRLMVTSDRCEGIAGQEREEEAGGDRQQNEQRRAVR